MENDKIIFMGTPAIAADVLQALLDAKANVSLVVTQPDRKVGRKQKLEFSEVKKLALKHDIPVFQPVSIKKENEVLLNEKANLIVTCAFGQILSEENLNSTINGAVNLHGSLLPEYRGCAPIQRAIMDGKTTTGMALMKMEKGMDTGGVMDIARLEIGPDETCDELFGRMGKAAGELIVKNLETLLQGKAEFIPQDDSVWTYAPKIDSQEERVDFGQSDHEIYNQIRALSAAPGAWLIANGKKLKIIECRYIPYKDGESLEPMKILKEGKKKMVITLKDGKLDLKRVQLEGKPIMDIVSFVNGAGRALDGCRI
ncbi:methionyl-tRNA formyltransferase [Ileibacterium valens]|uniref:methionyl-tRNA formyltransferase n=1 Tax=Ileibacterium valens TaxID=1862668 RepID=UPI0024B9EED5|nr:methionyl-tRNA formyltransferase [Ileibacterium valens]